MECRANVSHFLLTPRNSSHSSLSPLVCATVLSRQFLKYGAVTAEIFHSAVNFAFYGAVNVKFDY